MQRMQGINYHSRLSNKYFIDNNIDKVLFLDIDGVLQSGQSRFKHIENDEMPKLYEELYNNYGINYSKYDQYDVAAVYYDWNKNSVRFLNDILVQSRAKIVLSSDWRIFGRKMMLDFFKIHDLHEFYLDNTIELKYFDDATTDLIEKKYKKKFHVKYIGTRTVEILEYLERHPFIKNYVAIDDIDLLPELEGHFVHTSHLLYEEHAIMAKKILSQ